MSFTLGDSELLHQLVERGPADAQLQCSGRDLPAMAAERVLNDLTFGFLPRLLDSGRAWPKPGRGFR
jgi:hypothetical protein